MPTSRRRHTITETEPIKAALTTARSLAADDVKDSALLADLIVTGARAKEAQAEAGRAEGERRLAARLRFLKRSETFEGIDLDALREVHAHGWARTHGE